MTSHTGSANEAHTAEDRADEAELAKFGYRQQLERSLGAFSSFAIAFSLISVLTGLNAGFHFGLNQVGPSMLWSWCVVAAGQMLVALVLAELATRLPLSGYGYQWSSRLANPHFGFCVGWLLVLQFLTGFPGVTLALADLLHARWFPDDAIPTAWIAVAIIAVIAIIQLVGIRLVSLINDMGVIAEIVGVVFLTVILWVLFGFRRDSYDVLFETSNAATGRPATWFAFASSLLLGAYCLTGFEASADLAEETHNPKKNVPWAVVTSLLSSAIMGALLLAGFLLAAEDWRALVDTEAPMQAILEARFPGYIYQAFTLVIYISIFACGMASMAATTRLLFSLARDNMLPASRFLSSVDPRTQAPRGAILLVWAVATVVTLSMRKIEYVTSVSVSAGYLGYAGILLATLWPNKPHFETQSTGFRLGAFRVPLAITGIVWAVLVAIAMLAIPDKTHGYIVLKTTGPAIFVGAMFYLFLVRGRLLRGQAGPPLVPAENLS